MNPSYAIDLQNIQFAYEKGKNVLSIPSLQIKMGEKVFLQGASGSGKTTLLNLITGTLSLTAGKMTVLQQDWTALSPTQRDQFRADHMGFVFQSLNLIPYLSPMDNVLLPLKFSTRKNQQVEDPKQTAMSLFASLGLSMKDIERSDSVGLSQGQQQRLAVARAFIGNPEIFIADEPTSALDTTNRDGFIELLCKEAENRGTSILFVSHDPSLAKYFDRTILLDEVNQT